jgi:hypothetical protein
VSYDSLLRRQGGVWRAEVLRSARILRSRHRN